MNENECDLISIVGGFISLQFYLYTFDVYGHVIGPGPGCCGLHDHDYGFFRVRDDVRFVPCLPPSVFHHGVDQYFSLNEYNNFNEMDVPIKLCRPSARQIFHEFQPFPSASSLRNDPGVDFHDP